MKLLGWIDAFYSRLVVRVWLWKPGLRLDAIRRFQAIESDGTWHLFQILRMTPAPKERAKIFQHILEEDCHADLFRDVYQCDADVPFQAQTLARADLVANSTETWRSLIFVHVGETSATRRFLKLKEALGAIRPKDPLCAALDRIARDEEGHIALTDQLAKQLQLEPRVLRRELFFVHLGRINNGIKQSGLWLVNQLGLGLLVCGYWLFGVFGWRASRKRIRQKFILVDNNQIKSFTA